MKHTALRAVPREKLESMAMNMRRKARNAALDRQRITHRIMTGVVGAGSAFGMGYLMGSRQAAGESTDIGGVDMELVIGGVTTLGGVLLQGKGKTAKAGEFLEAAGMGVLAYYAGSRGEQLGGTQAAAA